MSRKSEVTIGFALACDLADIANTAGAPFVRFFVKSLPLTSGLSVTRGA